MPLLPDVRRTRPGADRRRALTAIPQPEGAPAFAAWHPAPLLSRLASLDFRWRYPLAVYLLTRIVYLVVAFVAHFVRTDAYGRHWGLGSMVSNWDGKWYLTTAVHFYPHYVDRFMQNTLGFFPLYPMLMRGTGQTLGVPYWISGLMISLVTGAAATVLVGRLARIWWGEGAARRAVLFFCVFPGSIVFSMVYTEGLLLMLVAGSMLAIERRRWLVAGLLAGLATAVGPVATAIIPACGVAAISEIRRRGWRDLSGWRALLAPALAPAGIAGFAIFLWSWTGTPFASFETQRYDWHETTTPLALPRVIGTLFKQAIGSAGPPHPNVDLNLVAALLGTAFLVWALVHLWRSRGHVPAYAIVWTLVIGFMTVTSNATPPNARMLICAFPAVLVVAAHLRGRAFTRLLASSTVLLVAMSLVTFVGTGLRP